jgi:hypothetical protein
MYKRGLAEPASPASSTIEPRRTNLHDGGTVVVEETVAGVWIDAEPLRNAVRFVGWAEWRFGQEPAAAAGGPPAVGPAEDASDQPEEPRGMSHPTGMLNFTRRPAGTLASPR